MIVYTVTQTHIPVGEIAVSNIACPHCQKEQLRMQFFNLREDSFFHAFTNMPAIPLVTCSSCHAEIARNDFNKQLTDFYRQHQQAYRGKFRFWFKWKFVVIVAACVIAAVVSNFQSRKNAHDYEDQVALVKQHLAHPVIGDIFETWVSKESTDARKAPQISQRWFKLIRIDGNVLIMQQDTREYNLAQDKRHKDVPVRDDIFEPEELKFESKNGGLYPLQGKESVSVLNVSTMP